MVHSFDAGSLGSVFDCFCDGYFCDHFGDDYFVDDNFDIDDFVDFENMLLILMIISKN